MEITCRGSFINVKLAYKVRKEAKIRNQYNQVQHLIQDTTRESDKNTKSEGHHGARLPGKHEISGLIFGCGRTDFCMLVFLIIYSYIENCICSGGINVSQNTMFSEIGP